MKTSLLRRILLILCAGIVSIGVFFLFKPAPQSLSGAEAPAVPVTVAAVVAQEPLLIVVAGLLGTVGHFMFIRAFQHAPASALTPFTYLQLVWATLIGWAAFDRFPDRYALAGMGVITCSGLLVALHERRRARAALDQPPVVD